MEAFELLLLTLRGGEVRRTVEVCGATVLSGELGGSSEARPAGWLSGGSDDGGAGAAARGEGLCTSGDVTGVSGEVGSPSRHEQRTARLSSISLAVSDCTEAGILGGELLREGEGNCTLGGGGPVVLWWTGWSV